MSLLEQLVEVGFFKRWETHTSECPDRFFYFGPAWSNSYNGLKHIKRGRQIERDLSERGKVSGLVNDFVRGTEHAMLMRPIGYGMGPPLQRLRSPREAVAYFRTEETRTFGFFQFPNHYYALYLEPTIKLKADKELYESHGDKVLKLIDRLNANDVDITTDVEDLITP